MKKKANPIPYSQLAPSKEHVLNMFDNLADNYDELNHSMSIGVDKVWRKDLINYLSGSSNIDSILDVATGTGDLSIEAYNTLHPSEIVGIDISNKMIDIGEKKVNELGLSQSIQFTNADCLNLPYVDNRFDVVMSAFALRNFENLDGCISEMYRVLKPGGIIAIIDLCNPVTFPMKQLFWCYKKLFMPIFSKHITHSNSAYKYLPYTMSIIPQGEDMCNYFSNAGFSHVNYRRLKFQMCILYTGNK